MSDIASNTLPIINGTISDTFDLAGTISDALNLSGKLSVGSITEYPLYEGDYEFVSKADIDQTVATKNRVLTRDIVIEKIEYIETSNTSDGLTVYIG